jgi:hypothetical protein
MVFAAWTLSKTVYSWVIKLGFTIIFIFLLSVSIQTVQSISNVSIASLFKLISAIKFYSKSRLIVFSLSTIITSSSSPISHVVSFSQTILQVSFLYFTASTDSCR